ncbi:FkbM family methyltransferase [Flavobacterium sp.]|uniref:FkbM family methyltransferase n=1 Tax=Flavobacterium sp. TaxID=239 RepID=UPI00261041C6|nr:FkbM family methyltransferase [Flavobacterium sp.]
MLAFLFKPTVAQIAKSYLSTIKYDEDKNFAQVHVSGVEKPLYWPTIFPIDRINQVVAETFDTSDWHYYQKKGTEISENEVLLDVGTAEGLFALSVSQLCKEMILVEPSKSFCEALSKTFENSPSKVRIVNAAVGDYIGKVTFAQSSLDGSLYDENTGGEEVDLLTIDAIVGDTPITYLKADVEGFEQQLINGAKETIKRCKPKIAITSYHPQNNAHEMITAIKQMVPEYKFYTSGIFQEGGKPVMIHGFV